MADKQVTFPIGLIPSWSNDVNFVDPGEGWDATPTKVEPGAGKRNGGWLPKENAKAQHTNQLLNELGRWVQYFSTVQVMNWFDVGDLPGAALVVTGEAMVYDEGIPGWMWGGKSDRFTISNDGWNFGIPFASGTALIWQWGASAGNAPAAGPLSLWGTNALNPTVVEYTGGWASQLCPAVGLARTDWGIWDPVNSLWLIGGIEDTGGTPTAVFWYDATPITGFTKVTPAAAANSTTIIHMAHGLAIGGGALNVAVGDGAAPNFDVWTSTNGTVWAPAAPTGITAGEDARSLMWDPTRELFVLLTNKSCYTSTSGTAWSVLSTQVGTTFAPRCVANDGGGLYVAGGYATEIVHYSNDGGVTWRLMQVPPGSTSAANEPIHNIVYSRFMSRFMIVRLASVAPTVEGAVAMSLAVGETPLLSDGTVSAPTVT